MVKVIDKSFYFIDKTIDHPIYNISSDWKVLDNVKGNDTVSMLYPIISIDSSFAVWCV